jgi:hypothetical protein
MAYAAAGLATASGGAISAEGEIHYSGPVNYAFHGRGSKTGQWHSFPLSNGARLWGGTIHINDLGIYDYAYFGLTGAIASNSLRAVPGFFGVAALPAKSVVSQGSFSFLGQRGVMQGLFCSYPDWKEPGIYYVGFRFGNGAGAQYGWVRIQWAGCPANFFIVRDYAWGDPGDQIKTGQRRLPQDVQVAPEAARKPDPVPRADSQGSLGLLALGAVGLQAWRKARRSVTPCRHAAESCQSERLSEASR